MLGRPTVMTPETIDKLREAFLMGYNDREACLYADIGLQTLYDYQKANPDYSEQKELFKINPILKAKNTIYNELEKRNVKVAIWYLERKAREEFSDKIEIKNRVHLLPTSLDELKTNYFDLAEGIKKQLSEF